MTIRLLTTSHIEFASCSSLFLLFFFFVVFFCFLFVLFLYIIFFLTYTQNSFASLRFVFNITWKNFRDLCTSNTMKLCLSHFCFDAAATKFVSFFCSFLIVLLVGSRLFFFSFCCLQFGFLSSVLCCHWVVVFSQRNCRRILEVFWWLVYFLFDWLCLLCWTGISAVWPNGGGGVGGGMSQKKITAAPL